MGSFNFTSLPFGATLSISTKELIMTMDQEPNADVKPGGLSFEVVLEDAKTSEKPSITPSAETPSLTAEEIEKKLQECEDRRKSLESQSLERLAEQEKRTEEARAKKAT